MIIEVNDIDELADGSVVCELYMDKEAKRWLIERGFNSLMSEALKKDPEWWTEEDEKRVDVIGQNGPTGEHYE
jgi:hypothetical protein